jgi:hypothetical protein
LVLDCSCGHTWTTREKPQGDNEATQKGEEKDQPESKKDDFKGKEKSVKVESMKRESVKPGMGRMW